MGISRSDLILLGAVLAIIIFSIVITNLLQTEVLKRDVSTTENITPAIRSFSQIKTYGPVWNSDQWSCSSTGSFIIYGALRAVDENSMIEISVVKSGTQSLYELEPKKLETFSVGATDDTITITRTGTVTGFLTLHTTSDANASCTQP